MESSRTSLTLRTHFEVLSLGLGLEGQVHGLGLEASSPRKLSCPRLEDSTFFELSKFCRSPAKKFWKTVFTGKRLKKNFEELFFVLDRLKLASSVPVLGLERFCPRKGCPWPRIFFVSLALASSLVSSTPPLRKSSVNFRLNTLKTKNNSYDLGLVKT